MAKTKKKLSEHPPANVTASAKAGIIFPVARIRNKIKKGGYADRVGIGAAVYMAAVLEYLAAEVIELAGNACKGFKKHRINPRHIMLAIRSDEELSGLCQDVTFPQSGVVPNLRIELLPKKKHNENASVASE